MPGLAFDCTVAQFLWLGLEPRIAHNLATLRYPDERLHFQDAKALED
jgi:hypothetical protein